MTHSAAFKVLIVEDENLAARRLRKLLESALEGIEFEIHHVATPEEALIAMNPFPDLLVLDLNLGTLCSIDWVRAKKVDVSKTIIVSADTRYVDEAFEAGVAGYLFKPLEKEKFIEKIHSYLHKMGYIA